ncbi:hypothetical protein [Flavobacterium sp.]|uniref:hypothetical protein n=1 Tax=Flavobacterium sp. TaxID=239 RepID=UPI00261E0DCC|nr:hypothetical protein [Flavobacterium sp.]MDD3004237.1 hypothetical protein [Flavobacterium sp.]
MQFKQIFFLILLFVLSSSCDYFNKPIPSKEALLEKELKAIDWNKVDQYPSVVECDSIENQTQKQQCFFEYLTAIIQQKLSDNEINFNGIDIDTIIVKVIVYPDATIDFEPQFPQDSVAYDTIKMDSLLNEKLKDFPRINPAIKRGIPVKTQFILPVILKKEHY